MKQRIVNKIEKQKKVELSALPKIKSIFKQSPSLFKDKLVIGYQKDQQDITLTFDPHTHRVSRKAQSLRDVEAKAVCSKPWPNVSIKVEALGLLHESLPRKAVYQAGQKIESAGPFVNAKAQTWLGANMAIPADATIRNIPQTWADKLDMPVLLAAEEGLTPKILLTVLQAQDLMLPPEILPKVVKEQKPQVEKQPRIKKEKIVHVKTPEEIAEQTQKKLANKARRNEDKAAKIIKGPRAFAYQPLPCPEIKNFELYSNVALGADTKSEIVLGMVLSGVDKMPMAEIRFYAQAHMVGCQFVDYTTQTSKTLITGCAAKQSADGKLAFEKPYYQEINVGQENVTVYDSFDLDWNNLNNVPVKMLEAELSHEDFAKKFTSEFLYPQMAHQKPDNLEETVLQKPATPLFARKINKPVKNVDYIEVYERNDKKCAWQTYMVANPAFVDDSINTSVMKFSRDVNNKLDTEEAFKKHYQAVKANMTMFVPDQDDAHSDVYKSLDMQQQSPKDYHTTLQIMTGFRLGFESLVMCQEDKTGVMMRFLKQQLPLADKLFSKNKINVFNPARPSTDQAHAVPLVA